MYWQYIIIIVVLVIISGLIGHLIVKSIETKEKTYEYALNGQIYTSTSCYQREDGKCFCKDEKNYIEVDNYYEVD